MSGQGFASMSKQRQKEMASKGGKIAQEKGTAHKWSSEKARLAGLKGAAARKRNLAQKAALRLLKEGFDQAQLNALGLSEDEYLYYAGRKAGEEQRAELKAKIAYLEAQQVQIQEG